MQPRNYRKGFIVIANKRRNVREMSHQLLLTLTPETNTYLLTSALILPLIHSLADVITTDVPYVNDLLQVIVHALCGDAFLDSLREEVIK
jgi:hypothetical protein